MLSPGGDLAGDPISAEVKAFIQSTINSVEQLEVLLFLMSNADREWSAQEVSERVRSTPESVAEKMAGLHTGRLLAARDTGVRRYRYAPVSGALAEEVAQELDRAYRERKDTVIQLVFSRPLENIRVFADAFRVRRKD